MEEGFLLTRRKVPMNLSVHIPPMDGHVASDDWSQSSSLPPSTVDVAEEEEPGLLPTPDIVQEAIEVDAINREVNRDVKQLREELEMIKSQLGRASTVCSVTSEAEEHWRNAVEALTARNKELEAQQMAVEDRNRELETLQMELLDKITQMKAPIVVEEIELEVPTPLPLLTQAEEVEKEEQDRKREREEDGEDWRYMLHQREMMTMPDNDLKRRMREIACDEN